MRTLLSSVLAARMWLMLLLIAGVVIRAAVPTGYMLDRSSETGDMVVRLCGAGLGHKFANFDPIKGEWVQLSGSEAPADPDSEDKYPPQTVHSCEFALSMVADLPGADGFALSEVFGLPLLAGRVYVSDSHRPVILAPLPARGPPSLI